MSFLDIIKRSFRFVAVQMGKFRQIFSNHSFILVCLTGLYSSLCKPLFHPSEFQCVTPNTPTSLHQLGASRGQEVTAGAQLESVSLLVITSADACLSGIFSGSRRSNCAAAAPGRTGKMKFRDSVNHSRLGLIVAIMDCQV